MRFIVRKLKVCRQSAMSRVGAAENLTLSPHPKYITTLHSCVHEILALHLDRRN